MQVCIGGLQYRGQLRQAVIGLNGNISPASDVLVFTVTQEPGYKNQPAMARGLG